MDGGQSFFSRLFKTKGLQFLGQISMALYLVQVQTIFWMTYAIYGKFEDDPREEDPSGFIHGLIQPKLPLWAVPIYLVVSLILGTLLTFYLEEPARVKLKHYFSRSQKKSQ